MNGSAKRRIAGIEKHPEKNLNRLADSRRYHPLQWVDGRRGPVEAAIFGREAGRRLEGAIEWPSDGKTDPSPGNHGHFGLRKDRHRAAFAS